ncbi:MAG: glycosyltransferase family 39 protein [candidate division WOR-3 bacterium]
MFRLLCPYAWFEDCAYLYHAFAFKSGLKPFVDTLCVHPPTIEYLLAGLYNIFGVSYQVAEIMTAVIVAIATVLLFDISKNILGKYIALFVVASFSFSSLLFRYHIFEREIFTLSISILVMWIITRRKLNPYSALLIGILAGFGFGIKFSGLFILPPIIIYLLSLREYKTIFFSIIGFVITSLVIYGYFLLRYKEPAYIQLFVFHFFKGFDVNSSVRFFNTFIRDLNYLWLLGGSGIFLSAFVSRKVLIFPLVVFIEYTLFFLFISATCWPHNMIDLLLPMSLGCGVSIYFVKKFTTDAKNNIMPVILIIGFVIFSILIGSLRPDYYQGLGYIPRTEVAKAARFIQANTPDKVPIHCPHYLANEAQRLKIIDYEELIGPYLLIKNLLENKDHNAIENLRSINWYELIERTLPLWRNDLNNVVVERKVSCAVWDKVFPEWSLMYNIDTYLENKIKLFSNAGYEVRYDNKFYTIWLLK